MLVPVATPAEEASTDAGDRPVVGLVLSGGGAKGAAHVGVLRVLEELGVPVDLVVGTSMGAIVGGLYASGYSAVELDRLIDEMAWADILRDQPDRDVLSFQRKRDDHDFLADYSLGLLPGEGIGFPLGAVQGQRIMRELHAITVRAEGIDDFDDLPIRFRAVAADLITGETVVLDQGDLALAIRASMSIPGLFAPVELDDRLLVDGGLANNTPIDVARDLGAEVLIVVDVGAATMDRDGIRHALGVTEQSLRLLLRSRTVDSLRQMQDRDILIQPDVPGIGIMDFEHARDVVFAGEAAALDQVDALWPLTVPPVAYHEWTERVRRSPPDPPVVDAVRIDNRSRLGDDYIRARIRQRAGEPLDRAGLSQDLARLYGIGYFDRVNYRWSRGEDDRSTLVIEAIERSWGRNFLRFGLLLEDDFDGGGNYTAGIGLYHPMVNRIGGEWRADLHLGREPGFSTELWQPLAADTSWFVRPWFDTSREELPVIEDGETVARYRVSLVEAGLDLGRDFGWRARVAVGLRGGRGSIRGREGFPEQPRESFATGVLSVRLAWDSLDQLDFPTHGTLFDVGWERSDTGLGSSEDFEQWDFALVSARSLRDTTGALLLSGGTTVNGDAPAHAVFPLGGLFNLSGYRQNELADNHFAHAGLMLQQAFGDSDRLFGLPFYAGVTLEAGNVWAERDDIDFDSALSAGSVFAGSNTPLGPVYFGVGFPEDSRTTFYFYLGRFF